MLLTLHTQHLFNHFDVQFSPLSTSLNSPGITVGSKCGGADADDQNSLIAFRRRCIGETDSIFDGQDLTNLLQPLPFEQCSPIDTRRFLHHQRHASSYAYDHHRQARSDFSSQTDYSRFVGS